MDDGTEIQPQPPVWPMEMPPPPPVARRRRRRLPVLMLLLGLIAGGAIAAGALTWHQLSPGTVEVHVNDAPAGSANGGAAAVAQQLGPAVGTIINKQGGGQGSLGSGFVIAHDNTASFLVTNNHVVSGATDLHVVMPNGRTLTATLVGTDALDDLAVVSVPDASLPLATWGSSSSLQVGQTVVAIGSPLGNQGTVTAGVLSAKHRTISATPDNGGTTETLQDVLQVDAAINRGNSGGPLADAAGHVVGVNVAVAGDASNIGYSIPADLARIVTETLMAHQRVQHPYLGVQYYDSIDAIQNGQGFDGPGVLIRSVADGTPAAKAGFKAGDILVSINGVEIDNGETLGGLIQDKKVGDSISCVVKRNGQSMTLSATLVERPGDG